MIEKIIYAFTALVILACLVFAFAAQARGLAKATLVVVYRKNDTLVESIIPKRSMEQCQADLVSFLTGPAKVVAAKCEPIEPPKAEKQPLPEGDA